MLEVEVALEQPCLRASASASGTSSCPGSRSGWVRWTTLKRPWPSTSTSTGRGLDLRMLTVSTVTITTFSGSVGALDVRPQRSGVVSLSRQRKTATPGSADQRRLGGSRAHRGIVQRSFLGDAVPGHDHLSAAPVEHHDRITSADGEGQPAPCSTLAMLALKNATSTIRNSAAIGASFHFAVHHSNARRRGTATC